MTVAEVRTLLTHMNDEERRAVLKMLREDFGIWIHQIEKDWGIAAEAILEAIHTAPDLTQRGVRGVLAEAIFRSVVIPSLKEWKSVAFSGDMPFDLLLDRGDGQNPIKVQVKNQRKEKGQPKTDATLTAKYGLPVFVVETQRTRNGKRTGKDKVEAPTRPYHFGEFDLLAVCMQPSSGSWEDFIYCPAHLLRPRPKQPDLLAVMQPIFTNGNGGWTRKLNDAADVVRAHHKASEAT